MIGTIADGASTLRRGLLWLGGFTIVGTTVELAVERHWTQPTMLIAWVAVAVAAVALGLVVVSPSPGRIRIARVLAGLVVLSSVVGVGQHVYANFDAGILDGIYGDTWESLPIVTRWWLAVSKTVGPAPLLAPGALAQAGVCVLLATFGHPGASGAQRSSRPAALQQTELPLLQGDGGRVQEQVRREVVVLRQERVVECLAPRDVLVEPARRPAMERRNEVGFRPYQAVRQRVGEEVVIPVPSLSARPRVSTPCVRSGSPTSPPE